MAKQLQLRRGPEQAQNLFVGAEGEVTMTTDTKELRVHDGTKVGGFRVPTLVDVQYPSAANDYTWYRKYSDGWVEQGGISYASALGHQINLPVAMENGSYTLTLGDSDPSGDAGIIACAYRSKSVDSFIVDCGYNGTFYATYVNWRVDGMAA